MAELRQQLSALKLDNLQTYIQSGNLVFSSPETDSKALASQIKQNIFDTYGFEVPTHVWRKEEWGRDFLPEAPSYLQKAEEIAKLHVTLLAGTPHLRTRNRLLSQVHFPPDEFIIKGQAIYLYCPNGYGRTKLTNTFWERKLKVSATTRNWKTVTKLKGNGRGELKG